MTSMSPTGKRVPSIDSCGPYGSTGARIAEKSIAEAQKKRAALPVKISVGNIALNPSLRRSKRE